MNTEVKDRHFQIVTEIKQEVIKLTQENDVLRNCWEKEQAENEELRKRIRLLLQQDADHRATKRRLLEKNAAQKCQISDLLNRNEALTQGFFVVDTQVTPTDFGTSRIHNLEDGTIFKGNKGKNPRDLG